MMMKNIKMKWPWRKKDFLLLFILLSIFFFVNAMKHLLLQTFTSHSPFLLLSSFMHSLKTSWNMSRNILLLRTLSYLFIFPSSIWLPFVCWLVPSRRTWIYSFLKWRWLKNKEKKIKIKKDNNKKESRRKILMWISLWFSSIFFMLLSCFGFGSQSFRVTGSCFSGRLYEELKNVCRSRCRLLSQQLIKKKIYAIGELENSSILKKIKSCSDFHFYFYS